MLKLPPTAKLFPLRTSNVEPGLICVVAKGEEVVFEGDVGIGPDDDTAMILSGALRQS